MVRGGRLLIAPRYDNEIVSVPSADPIDVRPEAAAALRDGQTVVALESTLIALGLPQPWNLDTARAAEAAVRAAGAVPATIAVLAGRCVVGLSEAELERLASEPGVAKASTRDLAAAIASRRTAATTVAATMRIAGRVGIRTFATGGIGGVHRPPQSHDISADLWELARTPVAVVCAGAKTILDIPSTLEALETLGVPVIGYRCSDFPGFYVRMTGQPVSTRADDVGEIARLIQAHRDLDGAGVVVAQPVGEAVALTAEEMESALCEAERLAAAAEIRGPAVTPFLLARLAELTGGKTLHANRELIVANARLAAEIAARLTASPA